MKMVLYGFVHRVILIDKALGQEPAVTLLWRNRSETTRSVRLAMDYTITPSEDGTYIYLKVRGEITREAAMQQNLEAHALGKQLKIRRYLVDVTEARNVDPAVQKYEFAYTDMQKSEAIDRSALVATLVSPHDHSHDFVETVSQNAGLRVKFFTDLGLALQYLKDGLPAELTIAGEDG